MTFAYPHLLYFLIVPALLLVLAYVAGRSRSRKWERLVAPELRKELVNPPNHARRLTALLTGMLGLALLIAAMARPQWGEREVQEFSRGRNLLIAIDVSRSMLTRDVQPSRLEQARTAAFDLLDALPEDKIGLIVFSGEASLVVPLTHDHNAIRETLEQANYGWINYGGTNFNDVISLALKTFGRTEGTSALVLISDGETTEPLTPALADEAKESKLIVIAAGVGTASGDTIPDKTSPDGFFRDRSGKMIVSKLDSASLELLAKETGGQYASISSGSTLNQMVREVSKKLDERENATSTRKIAMERYAPFLGAGLFLTALSLMLSAQWTNKAAKGRIAAFALPFTLLLCLGFPVAQSRAASPSPAVPAPSLSEPVAETETTALPITEDLPLEMKSWLSFQNGYNDFKQGKFTEAASAFSQALLSEDKKVQTEAHYNLANSLVEKNLNTLKSKEAEKIFSDEKALKAMEDSLREAIRHYEDTLKEDTSHSNAQENKKIVEEIIKKLKEEKQKQDQQKKDQNKNDQQKQDQQKNDQNKDGQQGKDQQKNDQNKDGQQGKDQQKNDQNKDGQQGKDQQKNDQNKDGQQGKDQQKNDQNKDGQQGKDQQKNDQNKDGQQGKDQQKNNQNKDGQQGKDQQKNDQNKDGQQGKDQQKNDQNKDGQQPQPTDQSGEQAKAGHSSGAPGQQGDVEGRRVPVGEEGEHAPKDTPEEQAIKILKERSDLEKGNPMPQYRMRNNPAKDW